MEISTDRHAPFAPAQRTTRWTTAGAVALWMVAGGIATAAISLAALLSATGDSFDGLNDPGFILPLLGIGLALLIVPLGTVLGAIAWAGARQHGARVRPAVAATLLGLPSVVLWTAALLGW